MNTKNTEDHWPSFFRLISEKMKGLQPGKTLCFQKYSSLELSWLLKQRPLSSTVESQQKYDKATLVINMEMNFQKYVERC